MKLEKGDIVKTALSENTTVLEVKDNQAVLFSGTQFVLATGIKENKESGKFEWDNGRYANDLKSISDMQNNNFETMKETLSFLAEYNHSDFAKGIISLETGIENEDTLDVAYNDYMNDKIMGLVDEKFYDYIDDQMASKIELRKYYLQFKKPTLFRFALNEDFTYLNYDKETEEYFLNTNKESNEYQTRFTKKEIENIKLSNNMLPDDITPDMFDMIDVELYDLIEEPEEEMEI